MRIEWISGMAAIIIGALVAAVQNRALGFGILLAGVVTMLSSALYEIARYRRARRRKWRADVAVSEKYRQLLLDHLDSTNRRRYLMRRVIIVKGSLDNSYVIRYGTAMNVVRAGMTYCALPPGLENCPEAVMLAQKLALETDERDFLRKATARERMESRLARLGS